MGKLEEINKEIDEAGKKIIENLYDLPKFEESVQEFTEKVKEYYIEEKKQTKTD